jgi:glycosyltransferase involved in cell wall biosynthesis
MTPKLAIRTTCWNYGHFLRESLESSCRQTETDIEIVVINNGSTDATSAIADEFAARDPRVRVIHWSENRRLAAAENEAVRQTTAPWLLKVDADDKIHPTYVSQILAVAEQRPAVNCVFSPAILWTNGREEVYRYAPFNPALVASRLLIPGTAAFTRDLWETLGGFDERIHFAEDWDFWVRAVHGPGVVPWQLSEPLWWYRQHDGTPSTGPRMSIQGMRHLPQILNRLQRHSAATVKAHTLAWELA